MLPPRLAASLRPIELVAKSEKFHAGHTLVKIRCLRHVSHSSLSFERRRRQAVDLDRTGRRLQQTYDHFHDRRLTRSVLSEESEDGNVYRQREIIDNCLLLIDFRKVFEPDH